MLPAHLPALDTLAHVLPLPADRGHRFFARERSQAQAMLRGVLLTYERYNQDLGYVQGMSDLAAPCL